ncbi:larval cuticle protein 65Ag1-like [Hylaeus anthracinus]|uniref:larval cuticle protein 65Ag1-like n=1 Tax=Hylaeus anthracinus TaxID=313031 RepID=UPI0023B9E41E|nr:larval cuticle protein 65Ag1-like [Hylaeus anthracinus]
MKTLIVFVAVVAAVMAAPAIVTDPTLVRQQDQEIVLLKESPSDNVGLGNYNYGYELSDGQSKQESAELVPSGGTEGPFLKVHGSFSFVDPITNVAYTVNYIADENGFHPEGEHLPHA